MYSSDVIRPYSLSEAVFILSAKRSILFVPFIGCEAQLIVPVLSETADERFTKELIERQVQFMPQLPRAVADVPAMVLQSRQVPYSGQAYGIEVAGGSAYAHSTSGRSNPRITPTGMTRSRWPPATM